MISWDFVWEGYVRGDDLFKASVISSLERDGWMRSASSRTQIKVLGSAPNEVIDYFKSSLKPDALNVLKPNLIDWSQL